MKHVNIWERNIPGGGKGKYRAQKWDCRCPRSYSEASGAGWVSEGRRAGDEVEEVLGGPEGEGLGSRWGVSSRRVTRSKLCLPGSLWLPCGEWMEAGKCRSKTSI